MVQSDVVMKYKKRRLMTADMALLRSSAECRVGWVSQDSDRWNVISDNYYHDSLEWFLGDIK